MEQKRDAQIGTSAIALTGIKNELNRMLVMARENVTKSFEAVKSGNTVLLEEVRERETILII